MFRHLLKIINMLIFINVYLVEGGNASTTPHTRRIALKNSTDGTEATIPANISSVWEIERRDKYSVVKRYIPAEGKNIFRIKKILKHILYFPKVTT